MKFATKCALINMTAINLILVWPNIIKYYPIGPNLWPKWSFRIQKYATIFLSEMTPFPLWSVSKKSSKYRETMIQWYDAIWHKRVPDQSCQAKEPAGSLKGCTGAPRCRCTGALTGRRRFGKEIFSQPRSSSTDFLGFRFSAGHLYLPARPFAIILHPNDRII